MLVEKGADQADINKQKQVLEETVDILPDCKQRLVAAHSKLSNTVLTVKESKELEAATNLLAETSIFC